MSKTLSPIADADHRALDLSRGIPSASARTTDLTGYLHSNLEPIPGNFRRYALSAACAPNEEQRTLLLARRDMIDAGLAGADTTTIRERVGTLRSVMASQPLGPDAMQLAKAAFVQVLSSYPIWAISEACQRFLDGRAGNGTYAPTPAEIATLCRTLTAGALHERARINAILDVEIYTPPTDADREIVAQRFKQFASETAARAQRGTADARVTEAGSDAEHRIRAREHLAELAARTARRLAQEREESLARTEAQADPAREDVA